MSRAPADAALTDGHRVHVPRWTREPDHFVWEAFRQLSSDGRRRLDSDALQQEALLAQTTNFYVIPDQFGVVSGHVLVLPKQEARSIADLDPSIDDEVAWLLQQVSDVIAQEYRAQILVAEHGECGCSTADQAHVHVAPIPVAATSAQVRSVVDHVLQRRMVGIECVTFRGATFTALEDLRDLVGRDGAIVKGRQLRSRDFTDHGPYPASARRASGLSCPYVYFVGPGIQFVSTCSLQSQFFREIVAILAGLDDGVWDRRANPDRTNMFKTFHRLAPAFERTYAARRDFRDRFGQPASDPFPLGTIPET